MSRYNNYLATFKQNRRLKTKSKRTVNNNAKKLYSKLYIAERVKSRRQAYDKDLFDTSSSYTEILMNLPIFEECH